MSSIQLIKVPASGETVLQDKWYVPLDLVWLGTYLQANGYSVEILDGQILSLKEIKKLISAPIVGISFNILSSNLLSEIARVAKEREAFVIVGGQAATNLAPQILKANKYVDAIICYDGEEATRQIVKAVFSRKPLSNIPNLVYSKNGEIIENKIKEMDLTNLPMPDRRIPGIDMAMYLNNFSTTNTEKAIDGTNVTNMHSKKGCPKNCSFCARIDKKLRCKTPRQIYDELKYLVHDFGVDYVFDHSDTWIVPQWLDEFAEIYKNKGELPVKLMIFGDVRDVNPDIVEKLKTVGVVSVLMGIESGSEKILQENGKRINRHQIIKAVKLLTKNDINVSASYILGLMKETPESISETVRLAHILRDMTDRVVNYCNIITPLPGSWQWRLMMREPKLRRKYFGEYRYNMDKLRRDYLAYFCNLGPTPEDILIEAQKAILSESNLSVPSDNRLNVLGYDR